MFDWPPKIPAGMVNSVLIVRNFELPDPTVLALAEHEFLVHMFDKDFKRLKNLLPKTTTVEFWTDGYTQLQPVYHRNHHFIFASI